MTNYLYSVDVRNLEIAGRKPTQDEIHDYVVKELNFLKGQMSEDSLEVSHIMAVPYYGESILDLMF